MTLEPGTPLGPYRVETLLGEGGMGQVYRAIDTRLDRIVAIKVLPSHLSAHPQLRERFDREARAISSLSHPNICTLFDVGHHEGLDFLVMEHLEGESLADRLVRGPLPFEQVIRYGSEIAEALHKAHRAGVVHRDLKPGNVMITKAGAKLLDFGLAKIAQPVVSTESDPNAATVGMPARKPLTEEGTLLGTFQYMAPEQIEGAETDARTDIFALGALLYEAATGRRAFEAKSRASLIASILDREPPPVSTILTLTPVGLDRVIAMCLAKDPDARWQSAHDVAAELRWIGSGSCQSATTTHAPSRRRWLWTALALFAGLLLGFAATKLTRRPTQTAARVQRLSISTPPSAPLLLNYGALGISPDGTTIVYRAKVGNVIQLFARRIDSLDATPLDGTTNGHAPTFSPDGRWIAFSADNAVNKVPLEGGARVKIANSPGGTLGLSWRGDKIYATRAFSGGVWEVPAAGGGTPRQLAQTNVAKNERAIVWPDALPDSDMVLATVWSAGPWDEARVMAFSAKDGTSKLIMNGGYAARYSPTGHLLFIRGGNLMAVTFDPKTLTAGTNPVTLLNNVAHSTADGTPFYALSAAGHLIYSHGEDVDPVATLMWIDGKGARTPIVSTRRRYGSIALAPDQRGAAVTIEGSTYEIWYLDFERDSMTRISHGGDDLDAVFTPDGSRIVWGSSRTGQYNVYWRAADASTPEERLTTSDAYQESPQITPDGRTLVFAQYGTNSDIWMMPLDTRKPAPVITSSFNESTPSVSPDGKWLAYSSNESGRTEVYVTSFPSGTGKWQVSTDGGVSPQWMPSGREIVYVNERKFLIVPFETQPRPRPGKPRILIEGNFDDEYSIARDGRLAVSESQGETTANHIEIVLNWFEDLKRRVP